MNWNGIVSLLVACIELILIINLFAFAEKNKENKIAIVLVTVLFVYQSLEFLMCHFGFTYPAMAYFAFSDISLLPPLTLYFTLNFLDSPAKKYGKYIFIPALLFIIYYGLVVKEFEVVSCTVLYASYNYPLGTLYGAFYYIPLMIAMVMLVTYIKKEKNGKTAFLSKVLLSGNIIVFIPVLTAFILKAAGYPMLLSAIESIMCKFALVIALCFSFMCLYDKKQKSK